MKINWKLRFQNKAVLTGLVGAVLLFIKQVTELFGIDLSTQLEQVSGIIGAILTLLAGLGIITDPTTKGVSDTGIVQTYQKPRDSKNEDEQVEWQSNVIDYEPEQYPDELAEEVEHEEGLRDVEDNDRISNIYNPDINNSGVMLDTDETVEGAINNGEDTSGN